MDWVLLLKKLSIHHLHLHLSLKCGGRWGTTDDLTTSFLHLSLFSTALWDLANSRPVPFPRCCLPASSSVCLVFFPLSLCLARWFGLDLIHLWETCPYHLSLRLFTMVNRYLCGPIACWILCVWSSCLLDLVCVVQLPAGSCVRGPIACWILCVWSNCLLDLGRDCLIHDLYFSLELCCDGP